MSPKYKVDFATFCHAGDAHRLHAPGQLKMQISSNGYNFNEIIIIYQNKRFPCFDYLDIMDDGRYLIDRCQVVDPVLTLRELGVNIDKPQYISSTDQAHTWENHVVNHLAAVSRSAADYIVFADNDCWMVRQPKGLSWVTKGIEILEGSPETFIVSPNDGEPARSTQRMSQQMFLARVDEFRNADFDQPGWDGNVNIPGGPMPEYWAMLEGRMELYCRMTRQYRQVLGPEYRYWHHNILTTDGFIETDLSKY